ncbi:hypothetical protein [Marinomonas sp. 2405UD68-3]|uniref:hypothetical protein n=1 Tax=Marinomonas sp. 2405UD68-3 TaxID=3391835 RepID=UPI0039C8DF41
MNFTPTNNHSSVKPVISKQSIPFVPTNILSEKHIPANSQDTFFISEMSKKEFNVENWLEEPLQADFSSEKKDKITSLFEKLSGYQQRTLARNGMAKDDHFLSVTSKMNSDNLDALVNVADSIKINAQAIYSIVNEYYKHGKRSEEEKLQQFMAVLNEVPPEAMNKIISQAGQYAKNVNLFEDRDLVKDTYTQESVLLKKTSSSDDIQNFMSAVIDSEDPGSLVDKLNQFSPDQQNNLLNVFALDQDIGERTLDSLLDKSDKVKNQMLSFLGDVSSKTNIFADLPIFANSPSDKAARLKGMTEYSFKMSIDMMNKTVSLLENFDLSEEQILKMSNDLKGLDRNEQIAYLDISTMGLESLLEDSLDDESELPIDMTEHQDVMSSIEALRENSELRKAVNDARTGEDSMLKIESEYQESVIGMISIFTSLLK